MAELKTEIPVEHDGGSGRAESHQSLPHILVQAPDHKSHIPVPPQGPPHVQQHPHPIHTENGGDNGGGAHVPPGYTVPHDAAWNYVGGPAYGSFYEGPAYGNPQSTTPTSDAARRAAVAPLAPPGPPATSGLAGADGGFKSYPWTQLDKKASRKVQVPTHSEIRKEDAPFYDDLINYPRAKDKDEVRCVMCGNPPGGNTVIPRQNKDVCKECDKSTWQHCATHSYFKWCKGCKKFISLSCFVEKLDAAKCDKCRERGRQSYLIRKGKEERILRNLQHCGDHLISAPVVMPANGARPMPPLDMSGRAMPQLDGQEVPVMDSPGRNHLAIPQPPLSAPSHPSHQQHLQHHHHETEEGHQPVPPLGAHPVSQW